MIVECPECGSSEKIFFKRRRFQCVRDAVIGVFACSKCKHMWEDCKGLRVKYDNVEVEG